METIYITILENLGAVVRAGEYTITARLGEVFAIYDLDEMEWNIEGTGADGERIYRALRHEGAEFDRCTERNFDYVND